MVNMLWKNQKDHQWKLTRTKEVWWTKNCKMQRNIQLNIGVEENLTNGRGEPN